MFETEDYMRNVLLVIAAFSAAGTAASAATGFSDVNTIGAVANISTGAVKVARTNTVTPTSVSIDWGDGTVDAGYVAQPCVYCDLYGRHTYVSPGHHTVTIVYNTGALVSYTATTQANVRAIGSDDYVVVSLGDSVASGEGNPVIKMSGANPPLWDDGTKAQSACHISSTAGPAQAVAALRQMNYGKTITFIHLACSGATISDVITRQMTQLGPILGTHRVDALLLSAGANDVGGGFGSIVKNCALETGSGCNNDSSLVSSIASGLSNLPNLYFALPSGTLLAAVNKLKPVGTYITEYYDPTHNSLGLIPSSLDAANCDLSLISSQEWSFLYNSLVVPLNTTIQTSVQNTPWHYVGNIADDFKKHGYCASVQTTWTVDLLSSLIFQGDQNGTGHPNAKGHADYASRIVTAVNTYTLPVTQVILAPYHADAWSRSDVTMKFSASTSLPSAGIRQTYYAVDSLCTLSSPGIPFTGPVQLTTDGNHTVCYWSENNAGQFEALNTVQVMIDKTPPQTTLQADGLTIWLSASDATSGVSLTYYQIDGAPWKSATGCSAGAGCTVPMTPGTHTIAYYSMDNAKNREDQKSVRLSFPQ
jgi:lysophospholipase L1-like esterase